MKLKFSKHNQKLDKLAKITGKRVYSFSLLSGHTCPYAKDCFSRAIVTKDGMRIQDGKLNKFRCYSASQEVVFPSTYMAREHNTKLFQSAQSKEELVALIKNSLPPRAQIIRINVAGDFTKQIYLDAWIDIAKQHPDVHFYGYTKSTPFLVKRLSDLPSNLSIVASRGGRRDDLIDKHNLRFAQVVFSKREAKRLKLKIDTTDYFAAFGKKSFSLLIHGVGIKGSLQARLHRKVIYGQKR